MGKINRSDDNLFTMPKGSFIRNKVYVYINISNKYISPDQKKEKGTRGYTGHNSLCIGVVADPDNLSMKKFYANNTYLTNYVAKVLPDPPKFADSIAFGLHSFVAEASDEWKLSDDLAEVFGDENSQVILDLASYMISSESAVMQHFPAWAREHAVFSDDIHNDTFIGKFLRDTLTISKITRFREQWAKHNIGDGKVYLCYDSTNVNSQANGVFIVQKGHAKDDATLDQVNTDYVVRQSDGLPLTYLHSPGSVTDIAQAQEMIRFMSRIRKLSNKDVKLSLICDRGYISEKNLRHMDESGIGYILMLRTNFSKYAELANDAIDIIKSYKYVLETNNGDELYGFTRECTLYEGGPVCKAQIIWSNDRYRSKRNEISREIATQRKKLEEFIASSKNKCFKEEELKWVPSYFKLELQEGNPIIEEKRKPGRYPSTRIIKTPTYFVTGYTDDETAINREYQKSGIIITITSDDLTVQETMEAYSKRDCVEKAFLALKSHLGMDKIGVTTEEAMHGKGLIWFVASILHAILFSKTSSLRVTSRKYYTIPAMVEQLEAIKADKNLSTGKRQRRYKLTKVQKNILNCFKIDETDIDEKIAAMDI